MSGQDALNDELIGIRISLLRNGLRRFHADRVMLFLDLGQGSNPISFS